VYKCTRYLYKCTAGFESDLSALLGALDALLSLLALGELLLALLDRGGEVEGRW
jgi:hypothetical protein